MLKKSSRKKVLFPLMLVFAAACIGFAGGKMGGRSGIGGLVKGFPGVGVYTVQGATVLSGQVDSIEDFATISGIPGITNLVRLSDSGKTDVIHECAKEIGNPEIQVRWVHNRVILEGAASSDYEADRSVEMVVSVLQHLNGLRRPAASGVTMTHENSDTGSIVVVDLLRVKARKQ